MINDINFFTYLFISFCFFNIKAAEIKSNTIGEISEIDFSSVFLVQNDSLLKIKYDKIERLYKEEEYVKALDKVFILFNLYKKKNDNFWSQKTLFLIANIYNKTNKFKKSLEYYKKSLQLIKFLAADKKDIEFSDSNFARVYLKIGSSYQKLSVSEKENNKLHYLDSAKYYFKKIENLPQLNTEIEHIKAKAFGNLSGIYEYDSLYGIAKIYNKKAIIIYKKYNNNLGIAIGTNNLGNISLSEKKYKKAKEFYLEGIHLIKNENSLEATRVKSTLYYNLAWVMRNLKEYKAYDFQEVSYDLEDDIRDKEFRGIIEEMTSKYDFDKKKELFQKQEEVKLLKEKDRANTIVMVGVLIFILLLVIISYYSFRQKNLQIKITKSELLQTQNLDKLKSESQIRILNATIDGKEAERKQIAETLHDSVSALLSSANLHLQASRKKFNGSTPDEIDKSRKIINEASTQIRNLSHSLMSSVLLKFGLSFAIKDIAEKFSNSELTIYTQIDSLRRYEQNFEIKTYNIIQEFINNILKHSKAENAFIKLKEEKNTLVLEISDDGIGFDANKTNTKEGIGINQIDARIKMMKGMFKIITSENNGTQIKVVLPIKEKEVVNLL